MRAHDIKFTMNSGEHNGEQYGFTLAEVDGKKAWKARKKWYSPPSMIAYEINATVTAREKNIPLSGAVELKQVNKILEDLNVIFGETEKPVTLLGFDKREYPILVDKSGITTEAIIHEKEREPEYQVSLLCWGLYE